MFTHMNAKQVLQSKCIAPRVELRRFAKSVGEFMRYWGFRNIHGQIWTVIYLAREPLSGVEIGQLLGVSKALVSPAVGELEKEGLIFKIRKVGKFKFYSAHPNPLTTIQSVLKRREASLLERSRMTCEKLVEKSKGSSEKLNALHEMILTAMAGLELIINSAESDSFLKLGTPTESNPTPATTPSLVTLTTPHAMR